ncbi:thymidylate kinase [Cellulomonas sp. A375-1]|uniref:dTMP kinase n=1 Tax=Cellulomonas TaxID=1707 RepID=UPI0006526E37|nr:MULTISPECIES: dTMP kinase [Cellulomonas]KMM46088.1 thymidylate kinase [Cellulomonas sp. A375-1]
MPAPAGGAEPTLPGVFVSFEGGDGAGKSTQARLLAQWAHEHGREVVLTREPGGTTLGQTLRDAVLHGEHVDARTEALLYATDRAHHVASLVRPALARGALVVTDRYLDSSVAYQGSGRDLGADEVERLSLWATGGLLPAVTVLLDVDPDLGRARLTGSPDRLESAGDEFHRRTRQAFLDRAAAEPGRWLVLDGTGDPDSLAQAVRTRVAPLLGLAADRAADARGGVA